MLLRIHNVVPETRVDGPGVRASVFVQGCPIRCPGCAVPGTWNEDGGLALDSGKLAEIIIGGPQIEGVTFLGGEPFAQAEALAELGLVLRRAGLSIVTFTGYAIEHIKASGRHGWKSLLSVTDLLVDGPFVEELASAARPWVGSSNQRYHFLTPRYGYLKNELHNISNRMEIRLYPDGRVLANGLVKTNNFEGYVSSLIN